MEGEPAVRTLLFALSIAAGCAAPSDATHGSAGAQTYIGALEGTDVRIAVVRDDATFVAYLCGKGDTLRTHTRWFGGALAAERETQAIADDFTLRFAEDDDGGGLSGRVEITGQAALSWRAVLRGDEDSEVGLYESRAAGCRSGVIVWQAQPGPTCGAQGSFCDGQGQRSQVTPVDCAPDMPLMAEATLDGRPLEFVATRIERP